MVKILKWGEMQHKLATISLKSDLHVGSTAKLSVGHISNKYLNFFNDTLNKSIDVLLI